MNEEIWKVVPGFERYEVSTFGNVRRICTGKILKNDWGGRHRLRYKTVRLYNSDGIRKHFLLHKLVYQVHVGLVPEGHQVDHIDRDNLNNVVSNLRCVSVYENQANKTIYIEKVEETFEEIW